MAAVDQHPVDLGDEPPDQLIVHLFELGPILLPLALIAIFLPIENASVLRFENAEGKGGVLQAVQSDEALGRSGGVGREA
ncbi:MAG: hypothetical protein AAGC99_05825, partial [Pseudomonadota bacterium]